LQPFSEKLRVDEELKLSRENFIGQSKISSKTDVSPVSQLTATTTTTPPRWPVWFQEIHRLRKNETQLALPGNWKLLMTASNSRRNNGYFGATCWYPELQQVLIAH